MESSQNKYLQSGILWSQRRISNSREVNLGDSTKYPTREGARNK